MKGKLYEDYIGSFDNIEIQDNDKLSPELDKIIKFQSILNRIKDTIDDIYDKIEKIIEETDKLFTLPYCEEGEDSSDITIAEMCANEAGDNEITLDFKTKLWYKYVQFSTLREIVWKCDLDNYVGSCSKELEEGEIENYFRTVLQYFIDQYFNEAQFLFHNYHKLTYKDIISVHGKQYINIMLDHLNSLFDSDKAKFTDPNAPTSSYEWELWNKGLRNSRTYYLVIPNELRDGLNNYSGAIMKVLRIQAIYIEHLVSSKLFLIAIDKFRDIINLYNEEILEK